MLNRRLFKRIMKSSKKIFLGRKVMIFSRSNGNDFFIRNCPKKALYSLFVVFSLLAFSSLVGSAAPTQSIPFIAAELETGNSLTSHGYNETIVGYWKLNRYGSDDESKVLDETGINNGTPTNFDNTSLSGPTYEGRIGSAFNFDGVDDYVSASLSPTITENNSYSIGTWIKRTGLTGSTTVIWEGQTGSSPSLESLGDNNNYRSYVSNSLFLSTGALLDDTWYNIVAVYDESTSNQELFVNGVSKGTNSIDANDTISTFYIGSRGGVSFFFNGSIDEVIIYNVSLSADEIMNLYLDGLVNKSETVYTTQDLGASSNNTADVDSDNTTTIVNWYEDNVSLTVLNMPFDSNSTYPARDYSVYNNSGALGNGSSSTFPTWNSTAGIDKDIPGLASGAYEFDGVDDYIAVTPSYIAPATIMGWFYFRESATSRGVSQDLLDTIYQHSANNLLYLYGGGEYFNVAIPIGSWVHIAMTYTSNSQETAIMYLNGEGYSPDNTNTNVIYAVTTIGKGLAGSPFNGTIDEVQIYNRSLSAEEIKQLYLKNYGSLVSEETNKSKSYKAEIYLNDGFEDSLSYNTTEITILNSAPTVTQLIPADNENLVTYTPTFTGTYSDADTDAGTCDLLINNSEDDGSMISNGQQIGVTSSISIQTNTTLTKGKQYLWAFMCDDGDTTIYTSNRTVLIKSAPTGCNKFFVEDKYEDYLFSVDMCTGDTSFLSYLSCSSLETDASGNMICGTDEGMSYPNIALTNISETFDYDLNVEGDLDVEKNFTGNQIYGEMWNYSTNATAWEFPIASSGVYYNLTNLSKGQLNGFFITKNNHIDGGTFLTAQVNGIYKADLALSFEGVNNNQLYAVSIAKNHNVENSRQCYARRFVSTQAIVASTTISCFIPLNIGDTIVIQVENEQSDKNIKIHTINLNLVRIGN